MCYSGDGEFKCSRIWPNLRFEPKLKTGQSRQEQTQWTLRIHKGVTF